jgi:PadR family transcriptional regulator, regulatory protein PadR
MTLRLTEVPRYVEYGPVAILGVTTMPTEKNDLHRGTLDMLILKIVAAGPLHGYAIAQRLQQISKDYFQVPQGSLYPALHRLEERGWVDAEWKDTSTGREAKFYKLTSKGKKQLEVEVLGWERLSDAVALILRTAD